MKRWIVGVMVVGTLVLAVPAGWALMRINISVIEIDRDGKTRVTPTWGTGAPLPNRLSNSATPAPAPAAPVPAIQIIPSNASPVAPASLAPDQLFAAASPAVAQVQ